MNCLVAFLSLSILLAVSSCDTLPTVYEYYTSGGISSGLSANQSYFTLNGRNISIYSGALHYFRVPRAHWRDGLKKIRAAGLNTVETYIPWNLHEPQPGVYDFGDGGTDMEDFLHLEEFLQTAQDEDLLVILRPGPYICAEFSFGGFPVWLLREKEIRFRTSQPTYINAVERYFNILLPILSPYQFTKGGPVIAFQVENEYGYSPDPELEYVKELYEMFVENGIVEQLVTSDPIMGGLRGTLPDVMYHAINFGDSPDENFDQLLEMQPDKPLMAIEFWAGWFDFWGATHYTESPEDFRDNVEKILKYPASVNFYMFYGATNFGFLNGAAYDNHLIDNSGLKSVTTSYNFDSPLTEAGDYTQKELLQQYNPVKTYRPDVPELVPRVVYPSIKIQNQLLFNDVLEYYSPYSIESENVISMELLDINNKSGQAHGYIVYRKENVELRANTVLMIEGHICDTAMVLVDGVLVSPSLKSTDDFDGFGYWRLENSSLELNTEAKNGVTIDIVVEEWGRMNGGQLEQYNHTHKGLWQGDVYLNDEKIVNWKIIPLEFKKDWVNSLEMWSYISTNDGPSLYYVDLEISDEPRDTYLDMTNWIKGIVTVNGFNLGRYLKLGPQFGLYLPAEFLKQGHNIIIIFEHFKAPSEVSFSADPVWGNQ
ncbi:hypothetical protein NQ318_021432 [Aromia moschata]|uniref:Beta-galactosidase n=1 Tax=Aromia moschata TaxID=1265417 RepID=A0AAV8ZBR8_9CUCU|nr:hypothetical protein NQ318_021432 [Aromia moschata]